jgi:hypothetical protein
MWLGGRFELIGVGARSGGPGSTDSLIDKSARDSIDGTCDSKESDALIE